MFLKEINNGIYEYDMAYYYNSNVYNNITMTTMID